MTMIILTIIGSLALFLYGMKLLSEALQRVAGGNIRRTMVAMTGNPGRSLLSGLVVTTAVQSSSAVTVMIVSFVNAGLVNLRNAVAMIMGANIGTTITAWLICIFGFGLSIGDFALPLAGVAFAFILMQGSAKKSFGSLLMGVALLFLGLQVLQATLLGVMPNSLLENWLIQYSKMGYSSLLLFMLLGTIITSVIQSSSATIVVTLVMCQSGWMPMEAGMAMILGENIGTTITANLAAVMANTGAKRAALAHTLINVFGMLWMLPLLPWAARGIEFCYMSIGVGDRIFVPMVLATFHTGFNVLNVSLLFGFTRHIARLVTRLLPNPDVKETGRRLRVLDSGILSTAELSLLQAHGEMVNHAKRTLKMFGLVRLMFRESERAEFEAFFVRIEKYADISDAVEREIISYLAEVSRGDISDSAVRNIQSMFRCMSYVENISELNLSMAKILSRKREAGVWFNQELRDNYSGMLDFVEQALYLMISNMEQSTTEKLQKLRILCKEIDLRYTILLQEQMEAVSSADYKYSAAMLFSELIKDCQNIGNSISNVANHSERQHG